MVQWNLFQKQSRKVIKRHTVISTAQVWWVQSQVYKTQIKTHPKRPRIKTMEMTSTNRQQSFVRHRESCMETMLILPCIWGADKHIAYSFLLQVVLFSFVCWMKEGSCPWMRKKYPDMFSAAYYSKVVSFNVCVFFARNSGCSWDSEHQCRGWRHEDHHQRSCRRICWG